MTKLQRYFFFLLITPFLMITIGLALLGILTQSLTQLDLLIERGQSPFVLLYISADLFFKEYGYYTHFILKFSGILIPIICAAPSAMCE